MEAKELKLRLFLQGVEVPVVSASIQIAGGGPAQASIQVVPSSAGLQLKPRTLVHLFSLDPMSRDTVSDDLDRYILIFGGEVVGVQWMRYPPALILQCLDWSSYWDTAYQYFMTLEDQLSGHYKLYGAATSLFSDLFAGHLEVTARLLSQNPKSPYLQQFSNLGMLSGLMRLIEAVGGVPGQLRGCNDFFSIAEMMLHITQQIGASRYDDTNKLFNMKAFNAFLNGGSGASLGQLASVRDVLAMAMGYIFYDVYPNPAPYYIPETTYKALETRYSRTKPTIQPQIVEREVVKVVGLYTEELPSVPATLHHRTQLRYLDPQYTGATTTTYSVPITEKVVEPIDLTEGAHRAKSECVDEIARLSSVLGAFTADAKASEIRNAPASAGRICKELVGLEVLAPAAATSLLKIRSIANTITPIELFRLVSSEFLDSRIKALRDKFSAINRLLETLLKGRLVATQTETTKIDGGLLQTQLFRPDLYFAVPPKCNVLFPDLYANFQYQRNFMSEPTRFELTTSHELFGPDKLLDHRYYSPPNLFARMRGPGQMYSGHALLMPHEAFTGIIPRRESISQINFYFKGRNKTVTTKKAITRTVKPEPQTVPGFEVRVVGTYTEMIPEKIIYSHHNPDYTPPGQPVYRLVRYDVPITERVPITPEKPEEPTVETSVVETSKVIGVPYAQRVANHLFYKYRFSSRVGSLDLVFNPHLVAGFPALIIEQGWKNPPANREAPLPGEVPVCPAQYVGLLVSISHTLSQTGQGTTNITLSHLRTHDGREDEFLSEIRETSLFQDEKKTTVLDTAEVFSSGQSKYMEYIFGCAPSSARKLEKGSVGPSGGKVQSFTASKKSIQVKVESKYVEGRVGGPGHLGYFLSEAQQTEWRSSGMLTLPSKVSIVELIPIPKGAKVSFEDTAKPAWMSDIYIGANIGPKYYQEVIGVDSIVDDAIPIDTEGNVVLTGGTGTETLATGEKPSTRTATEFLAQLYAKIYQTSSDTSGFSSQYIRRPIATLRQILGDRGISYDAQGNRVPPPGKTLEETEFGFHSQAVAALDNLLGLRGAGKALRSLGADKGKVAKVSERLDPRLERRNSVVAYLNDVVSSRLLIK